MGSLIKYIRKNSISNKNLKLWSFQIAHGMNYLSHRNIVHGNLAARNILLQSIDQAKISDVGIASHMADYKTAFDKQIVKWMAPEILLTQSIQSSASDVWSFGVTLYEMYSRGDEPYKNQSTTNLAEFVSNGGLPCNDTPDFCSLEIYEIIQKCWRLKPSERPDFAELFLFFKNLETVDSLDENIFIKSDKDHLMNDDFNANVDTISKSLPDKIIKLKNLRIDEQISVGEFGVVHKGLYCCEKLDISIPVAVKKIKKDNIETMHDHFLKEFAVMTKLEHPNIIKLIGE